MVVEDMWRSFVRMAGAEILDGGCNDHRNHDSDDDNDSDIDSYNDNDNEDENGEDGE